MQLLVSAIWCSWSLVVEHGGVLGLVCVLFAFQLVEVCMYSTLSVPTGHFALLKALIEVMQRVSAANQRCSQLRDISNYVPAD